MINLNDKNILITGGNGFLGTNLINVLKNNYNINKNNIHTFSSKEYNLLNINDIEKLLIDTKPNIVIHLAAKCGGIEANRLKPAEFFYENLMMGTQLLHQCYRYNVEKTVLIGTICAYPKFTAIPFKEEDIWNGYPEETNAPYGLAKKMLLTQSQAYRSQYNYNSIYLLPVNLYGPHDNFNPHTSHVIPALIKKCIEAKQNNKPYIEVWGDGTPTREFLYVEDAANAIIKATQLYNKSEPINIGSAFEISIKDLTEKIKEIIDYDGYIKWNTSKPNGQPKRKLNVDKAIKEFNFKSEINFHEGLTKTIDWYKNNILKGPIN